MLCIHVPISDSVWPNQNRRKFRWRARTLNGFSEGTKSGSGRRPAIARNLGPGTERGAPVIIDIVRSHTYSKFSPELADAVDLQALLDKLADFLLQSGFAGGNDPSHFGFDFAEENDRSMDALRQAIIDALMASNQFTPEMLRALRGEGTPEAKAPRAKLL